MKSIKSKIIAGFFSAIIGIALVVSLPEISKAVGSDDFEYHGYFRAGVGSNTKGGDQVCLKFAPPWADVITVGRLGNECDTYIEPSFVAHHKKAKSSQSASFYSKLTLAYKSTGDVTWEDNEVKIREIYTEAKNPFGKGMNFWAGDRFYRLKDIHIMDYWYYDAFMGYGAGVGIPVGEGTFSIAQLTSMGNGDTATENGEIGGNRIWHFRLEGLPIIDGLNLSAFLASGSNPGGETTDGDGNLVEYDSTGSTAFGAFLEYVMPGIGWNHFSYQSGSGNMVGIEGALWTGPKGKNDENFDDAKRTALVDQLYVEFGKFTLNAALAIHDFDNGADEGNQAKQTSLVLRPFYSVTDHFAMVAEYGYSKAENDWFQVDGDETSVTLTKLTLAPQITVGAGYWARPVIRAFVSMFNWSGDANDMGSWTLGENNSAGLTSGYVAEDDTSLTTYGFQTEVWW